MDDKEKYFWFDDKVNCNDRVGGAEKPNCKVIANNNFLTCIKKTIDSALA